MNLTSKYGLHRYIGLKRERERERERETEMARGLLKGNPVY
jgi:hypothetical protein